MPVLGERAVVLGASMSGLLAARVLSDCYFIEDFTPAHVMSALRCAEPIGEVARYRTPSSRMAPLRQDAAVPGRLAGLWRRNSQFRPDLRPGDDGNNAPPRGELLVAQGVADNLRAHAPRTLGLRGHEEPIDAFVLTRPCRGV